MANTLADRSTRREGLVTCPLCKGKGRAVHPKAQRFDPPCEMCGGAGRIDRDHTCICGRPLRLTEDGHVIGTIFSCGRKECKTKLQPKPPEKVGEVSHTDDPVPPWGEHYWDRWAEERRNRFNPGWLPD